MNREASRMHIQGAYFQIPFIIVFGLRGGYAHFIRDKTNDWTVGDTVNIIGMTIMCVSMRRIYTLNRTANKLITSDIFAVTRHPMYHGMFIADLGCMLFVNNPWQPLFALSWILMLMCMVMGAWYQERETLARWGKEAEDYYARTPRLAISWLWPF